MTSSHIALSNKRAGRRHADIEGQAVVTSENDSPLAWTQDPSQIAAAAALPLSHDEVVHGKGSLVGRMRGDAWQRFANLGKAGGVMAAPFAAHGHSHSVELILPPLSALILRLEV